MVKKTFSRGKSRARTAQIQHRSKRTLQTIASIVFMVVAVAVGFVGLFPFVAQAQPADVIIVLGSAAPRGVPGKVMISRLDHALLLYRRGYAPLILVSGGVGKGEPISEAAVMRKYLISKGVPPTAILVENRSRNTWENLAYSKILMTQFELERVLVVSSAFHLGRVALASWRQGFMDVSFSGEYENSSWLRQTRFFIREVAATFFYLSFVSLRPPILADQEAVIHIPQAISPPSANNLSTD